MNILVCVKQVPDRESDFRVDAQGSGLDECRLTFVMNEYDACAVEEAVRIKEAGQGVQVTALSIGPARAEEVVRRALEGGADRGVHILTPAGRVLDSLQTASLIASYARRHRFDLILSGVMSEDCQRAQTGPMTAALLDIPFATTVVRQNISDDRTRIEAERELEGGRRETVELPLPCLLTVQTGINLPRYPSLSNKLRARKQPLQSFELSEFPEGEKCQRTLELRTPPPAAEGTVLEGAAEHQADILARLFYERGLLR